MKRGFVILLSLIAVLAPAFAPTVLAQRRGRGFWHQEWTVDKGDTIPLVHILPIRKYARKPDMRRYARLVRIVKKVYPLAKQVRIEMDAIERDLLAIKDPKAQKEYARAAQKRLIKQYKPVILKMTFSEGRVLLKLIDRETDYTAYEVLREFRGGFIAGFWQTIGKIFGHDLKDDYDPEGEDKMIEQIVRYYEAGLL
jgi:hypothetical protein